MTTGLDTESSYKTEKPVLSPHIQYITAEFYSLRIPAAKVGVRYDTAPLEQGGLRALLNRPTVEIVGSRA